MKHILFLPCTLAALIAWPLAARADMPEALAAPGQTLVATIHAQGAQVYECKADGAGKLGWQFREPIATLFMAGKTVGRHYAGPSWELTDGSAVAGKVSGRAAGATAKDIPLLKLDATAPRGNGLLADIATIQRLNTRGGAAEGPCEAAGTFMSMPYSADYAFYKK